MDCLSFTGLHPTTCSSAHKGSDDLNKTASQHICHHFIVVCCHLIGHSECWPRFDWLYSFDPWLIKDGQQMFFMSSSYRERRAALMFPGFDCLNCFILMFLLSSCHELALTDSSGGSIHVSVPVSMLAWLLWERGDEGEDFIRPPRETRSWSQCGCAVSADITEERELCYLIPSMWISMSWKQVWIFLVEELTTRVNFQVTTEY